MPRWTLGGIIMLACAAALNSQQHPLNQDIDFRNFTYPFPAGDHLAVPGKMTWMSLNVKSAITLVNGRYDFDKTDPSAGPSVILDRVLYGYLTSAAQLDAVAILNYHTGGTANWSYVYAFSLASVPPKLVGWFRAGSRADFGLYELQVTNRGLVVALLDPERKVGDCCSKGFVRTHYTFRNGYFLQTGPSEFGTVETANPTRPKTP